MKKLTSNSTYTTYCIWEGGKVIAEYSNAPTGSNGNSYYLADRLSNRMITDTNGAFKGTQDHLPFGEEGGTSGGSEKHRFTNYERDNESNTDYAMNRQHQYANGRFVQPDVAAGTVADPQSMNRYAYSLNDPVNVADPLGLDPYVWGASVHGPGIYLDGTQVMPEMWGMVSSLWAIGAVDLDFPGRALFNSAPDWYRKEYSLQNPNDSLHDLPTGRLSLQKVLGLMPSITGPSPNRQIPIYCQPDVIAAMNRAWARTQNGTSGNEAGFVLNGTPNKYAIVDTKSGNTKGFQQMTINLPGNPNGATFALFHVHPNNGGLYPSTPKDNRLGNKKGDTGVADDFGIPYYVISGRGLSMYDPTKKSDPITKGMRILRRNLEWSEQCK